MEYFSWMGSIITRDTILGHPLDDAFAFRTAKIVRIQDRLLGGADLAIRTGIAVFVVLVLLMGQRGYVDKEAVVGTATWTLNGDFHGMNYSKFSYCEDHDCRFVDEHVMRGGGGADVNKGVLFVATAISEREQRRVCEDDADTCNRNSAFKTVKADTFYAAGVDDFQIQLSHEAMAPTYYAAKHDERFHGTDKDMEGKLVSFRDDGTGRVRMVDLQEIKPDLGLMMTLSELLDAAGLDLDKPVPAEDGAVDRDERPIRKVGVVIDCHIRYFNDWSTWSPASAVKYEIEFAPSSQQNALYSSTYEAVGFGDARMMVKRSGVYVRVLQEGNLERFSLVEMLQTLAIGFMLMTLSSWIMAQVATRYLPLAERYETHKCAAHTLRHTLPPQPSALNPLSLNPLPLNPSARSPQLWP